MRNKWRLKNGSDTLIIVKRSDLYPEELRFTSPRLTPNDLDRWLADPLARQTALEMFEAVHGRSRSDLRQAGVDELRRSVKPGLIEAFKRGDLVALRIPQLFLTQSPMEEAGEAPAGKAGQPPPKPAPPPRQKTWVEIELLDEQGQPMAKEHYRIELPDGSIRDGLLDPQGRARIDGIDPGMCQITFPDLKVNTPHRS
jgi:hypothetical protein